MRFLYFYRVPVPDPRADAVQIINTCVGIARAGGDVSLHVETLGSATTEECLGYYGLKLAPGSGIGRVDITPVGTHWSWPFFNWKTSAAALKKAAGPAGCLFVREVRPYVPGLIARAQAAGLRVIFEAHNISASLVKEKEARVAGPPTAQRTFSMVSPEGKAALKLVGETHDHDRGHSGPGQAAAAAEPIPPNVDTAPPPPPPPAGAPSAEARRLRRKAEQRATLEESILRAADGLICTQKTTLEGLRHLMKSGAPATVLGNGTQLPAAIEGRNKDIDVLYCGSLKPWKGVDLLVVAMQTLYPHKLTVVGPGTRDDIARLQQAALAVGMVERLKILPPVRPADVWNLYARAKVGVIPLPGEGFVEARDFTSPLKLFEMMAAGLPIVCSRLKSLQEYIADGREAIMVTPDDPRALADGLRKVLADAGLRSSLSAAARNRAAEFSWDSRGARIVAFATQLLR